MITGSSFVLYMFPVNQPNATAYCLQALFYLTADLFACLDWMDGCMELF